jgi:transcriptional regulator with XRE-family HTH domain
MDLRARVGRNIRRLRVEALMSQEALAVDAELETVYVSRIERGVANPTLRVLERIARALKVDGADLLGVDMVRVASPNLTPGRKSGRRTRRVGRR